MIRLRMGLGAVGVLVAAYGAWLLVTRGRELLDVGLWLVGGVVLHDAVLSAAVVAVGGLLLPLLPLPARAPAVVGSVVLGSVTLLAVPVLTGFGAREDNPTILDRDYWGGWLVLAGLTLVTVVVASLLRSRRSRAEA